MARTADKSSSLSTGKLVVMATLVATAIALTALGLRQMYRFVDRRVVFPQKPPQLIMVDRPAWMSDSLADQIIKTAKPLGLHSVFDHQLLVDTTTSLQSCPWVKKVNAVRRLYEQTPGDTLQIDCDYRIPTALVKWADVYWLVDNEGFMLPASYSRQQLDRITMASDGKVNLRIVEGIAHAPMVPGELWPGDDLATGLDMARILANREYTEQITTIDVSNYAGRLDPRDSQVVLLTRFDTQIRWGRPPGSKDAFVDVPVAQKLLALQMMFNQYHRVDANQPWVDISFDQVRYPKEASADALDPASAVPVNAGQTGQP